MRNQLFFLTRCLIAGFAQVIFQQRLLTGMLCILAIGLHSTVLLSGAALGASASLASAYLLQYERQQLASGLYGYNGVLIGLALFALYTPDAFTCLLVVAVAALSSVVQAGLLRTSIAPLTAAFVLLTGVILCAADFLPLVRSIAQANVASPSGLAYIAGVAAGVGQIFFLSSPLSGICIALALLLNNARLAGWALFGSATGCVIAWLLGSDSAQLINGIYGYNGALAALAVASRYPARYLLTLTAIASSTLLTAGIQHAGLVPLTAPFVLASWLVFATAQLRLTPATNTSKAP